MEESLLELPNSGPFLILRRRAEHLPGSPKRVLLLSLVALLVPLLSSAVFPEWSTDDVGMLVWLLALAPAFLLSFHHGWRGSALALAAAMAAFSVGQAVVVWQGISPPSWTILFGAVVLLLMVTLGSGWLSSGLHDLLEQTGRFALTDRTTRLPNRLHAELHLERAFAAARRGATLSVVIFDLDQFKGINDRLGNGTGDQVLVDFASLLKTATRDMNLSARIGGDEFLSILDGVDAEGAEVFVNRILESLREKEYPWGRVSATAGVAEYRSEMGSPAVLVAAADQALYRAKRSGGDCVAVLHRSTAAPVSEDFGGFPKRGDRRRGAGELVFVVDDDPPVVRTTTRALERLGYSVLEASDPEQALQVLSALARNVDLVLTDIVMPSMSGLQLIEKLQERQGEIPVVYMSGYDDQGLDWGSMPGAVSGFLPKPFTIDALATTVRNALDAAEKDQGAKTLAG